MTQFQYPMDNNMNNNSRGHGHAPSNSMTQFQLEANNNNNFHMFQLQSPVQKHKSGSKNNNGQSESEIRSYMKQIDRSKKYINGIYGIISKLYVAQMDCNKYTVDLSTQCIQTYISPAVLCDQFSNVTPKPSQVEYNPSISPSNLPRISLIINAMQSKSISNITSIDWTFYNEQYDEFDYSPSILDGINIRCLWNNNCISKY